jgi:hypothetical protein
VHTLISANWPLIQQKTTARFCRHKPSNSFHVYGFRSSGHIWPLEGFQKAVHYREKAASLSHTARNPIGKYARPADIFTRPAAPDGLLVRKGGQHGRYERESGSFIRRNQPLLDFHSSHEAKGLFSLSIVHAAHEGSRPLRCTKGFETG